MSDFFLNIKNEFDFFLRKYFKFSRKNYFESNTKQNELENLYMADILESFFEIEHRAQAKILDIGSKNWLYVKGEYEFFKKYCDNFVLDGIEIDSHRLYSNFYSRGEVAKFHIKDLENVRYLEKDFLQHSEKYDYIVWILPFVFEYPHMKWGLPLKHFCPEKMFSHALDCLLDEGKMLIINQGEAEYQEQIRLCEKFNANFTLLGKIESEFFDYTPRFGVLINKKIK